MRSPSAGHRKEDRESTSLPKPVALRSHPAAVGENDLPDDGEAEAGAAGGAAARALGAIEAVEYERQMCRIDAFTGIRDLNPHLVPWRPTDRRLDATRNGRVLTRIRQQVPTHLLEPPGVPDDCRNIRLHRQRDWRTRPVAERRRGAAERIADVNRR